LARAPHEFGNFGEDTLLVGNFGDGRINAIDLRTAPAHFLGALLHRPVSHWTLMVCGRCSFSIIASILQPGSVTETNPTVGKPSGRGCWSFADGTSRNSFEGEIPSHDKNAGHLNSSTFARLSIRQCPSSTRFSPTTSILPLSLISPLFSSFKESAMVPSSMLT